MVSHTYTFMSFDGFRCGFKTKPPAAAAVVYVGGNRWQHTWIINSQLSRDAMPRARVVNHRPFPEPLGRLGTSEAADVTAAAPVGPAELSTATTMATAKAFL